MITLLSRLPSVAPRRPLIRLLSGLALGVCCFRPAGAAQPDLIRNSDFESESSTTHLPEGGWWLYTARGQPLVSVDRQQAHGGKASVRLEAREDARFAVISKPFEVTPGDDVRFEAWVRGEKSAGTASLGNFTLAFRDAAGRAFGHVRVPAETRGTDWTQVSRATTVPANAVRAEIQLGYNSGAGRVWYDDVRAIIANEFSLSMAEPAPGWVGEQSVTLRLANRREKRFDGVLRATIARKTTETPIAIEPGASTTIRLPISLPRPGTFDYTITLLDDGTPARTLKGKFRASAPLVLLPACPCYHVVGGAGETRVDARIVVNPSERRGLRFTATVLDSAGASLDSADADASHGDLVGVTVRVPAQRSAQFRIAARLHDAAGAELARAETDVHVAPRSESQIRMGPDGFLRVVGRPHFPIGMYSSGQYEQMQRAGFSATHSYGVVTGSATDPINTTDSNVKELLDRSWQNGLRMMVELPREAVSKAQWAQVRRRIETFRHHPGLLCWGSEERVARGDAPLANVEALYRIVRELDPDHPLVLGDTRDVIGRLQKDRRDFFPDQAMDAGIWWWYPIPLHTPDGNGLERSDANGGLLQPPSWLTTTHSKKPLWIAIQSYQQPRRDARFPTPDEYRCMAYLSIINGVKGLWFYTGSGQRDWQGRPAGLLNKPEEGRWDYVQQLVRELRALEPVLLAPAGASGITLSPADAPVEFTTRSAGHSLYLIAANKSDRACEVRFTGASLAGRKATVLHENERAEIAGGALPGQFRPFGVHVYQLD